MKLQMKIHEVAVASWCETDVLSVAHKFSLTMEDKILKAIVDIRGKTHHRPWKTTIYDHFVKEGIKCSMEEVETSLNHLVQNGLIENRGAIGKDSFFILEAPQASQVNNCKENDSKEKDEATIKCTPYSDFLSLRAKVEVLVKAYEGSQAAKGTSEAELKQEILLLKKENESLRNELRRKDLLIRSLDVENPFMGSFGSNFDQNPLGGIICRNRPEAPSDLLQNSSHYEKRDEKSSFQLPSKRHSTRLQSPKPSWEPTDMNENRYACLARHPDIEESYASVVKSRTQSSTVRSRLQTEFADSNTNRKTESARVSNTSQARNQYRSQRTNKIQNCTEIIGDSIIKDIRGYKMNEACDNQEKIFVKSFSGATTDCMNSHACPTIKRNPKRIILHCGTNDLRSQASAENIAEEIIELAKAMKTEENTVFVSGLVARGDHWNVKVRDVNRFLTRRCQQEDLRFIDNANINTEHLNRSLLHLNSEGTRLLANNFLHELGYF